MTHLLHPCFCPTRNNHLWPCNPWTPHSKEPQAITESASSWLCAMLDSHPWMPVGLGETDFLVYNIYIYLCISISMHIYKYIELSSVLFSGRAACAFQWSPCLAQYFVWDSCVFFHAAEQNSIVWIYHNSTCSTVLGLCPVFWCFEWSFYEHSCDIFGGHVGSFLLGMYPGVELPGQCV